MMKEAIGIAAAAMVVIAIGVGLGLTLSNKKVDVEKVATIVSTSRFASWVERDNSTGLMRICNAVNFGEKVYVECTHWVDPSGKQKGGYR